MVFWVAVARRVGFVGWKVSAVIVSAERLVDLLVVRFIEINLSLVDNASVA